MDEARYFHHILSKLYLRSIHQLRDVQPEVDGMGAGDRGGMAALNRTHLFSDTSYYNNKFSSQIGRMIKKTRNPIICICNDSHSPKALPPVFV